MNFYNLSDKSILFSKISMQLKNDFNSSLTVSNEYTLDLAKCIYNYLNDMFNPNNFIDENDSRLIVNDATSVAGEFIKYANLYTDITVNKLDTPIENHIYDRLSGYTETISNLNNSVNDINKFNIASWPIYDSIIQYVNLDTVINPGSSLEDIALIQKMLSNVTDYKYEPGIWDLDLSKHIYAIQMELKSKDPHIVCSGMCDIYVEKYLRSKNEIRSSSYGNN